MKQIIILATATLLCLLPGACTEDKGNYDYRDAKDVIDVSFDKIEDEYHVALGENLVIKPEITGLIAGREYAYEWYVVTKNKVQGKAGVKITLSDKSDLEVEISAMDATVYYLFLLVKDVEAGVYSRYETELTVTESEISTGWYVLKGKDGMTDFDFIKRNSGKVYSDVLRRLAAEDCRLEGDPVDFRFQNSGYSHSQINEDGTTTVERGLKVYHILSTKDVRTFRYGVLTFYKAFSEQFYATPAVCKPQAISYCSMGAFIINDGILYTTNNMVAGVGKYGSPKIRSGSLSPMNTLLGIYYILGFDTELRSFCYGGCYGQNYINYFNEPTGGGTSSNDMEYDLIAMPEASQSGPPTANRMVLMKSTVNGKYYSLNLTVNYSTFACPIGTFREISSNSEVLKSSVFATQNDCQTFYFGVGNKLYYYDHVSVSDQVEFKLAEFGADETITYLLNVQANTPEETTLNHRLAVLTYVSSKDTWKLYIYGITTLNQPNISSEPVEVYQGEDGAGRGASVLRINS